MHSYKKLAILASIMTLSTPTLSYQSNAIQEVKTFDAPRVVGPYSQGTLVDLNKGKLLFVSGQSEDNPKTGRALNKSITEATNQTMDNIEAVLKAAGTSWENVVKVEIFLDNLDDWPEMNKEYIKRFPTGIYPARSAVQAKNGSRIEMTCIAFIPNKQ